MKGKDFVKKYTMVLALILVFILFTILTGGRLIMAQNISNLLLQNAYVLVMASGMLLCILTGGNVDLSVGSTLCLSAAIAAKLMQTNHSSATAVIVALLISAVIGLWQGWLVGYVHIPPFICTLAGMFLFRGIARTILDSKTISISKEGFLNLFTSYIQIKGVDHLGNCPSAMVIGIIIAIFISIFMIADRGKKAKQGYQVASMGSTIAKVIIFDILIIAYSYELMGYKGVPVMVIWILVVVLIFGFITEKTVFGRYFYAVGGNEKATKLSGIDPRMVYFWAYFLMSVLAGLSGLLVGARIGSVDGNMGNSYEMDAIASCFIGGASAYGGSGKIPGVMVGAILLGVINMGMSILGLPDQYQYIVKGAVLLAAVIFDVVTNHKTGKS
ncbi:MAG: sugar ABC transporter permease [Lachnospiraceae bacterium]|uniref:Xylose transport system permease protein XylH n=1 Tax=Candidatus Weimeria bifida TaxID=2599074 RepID=A0A6N7J0S2_9FIRM|nr:sugar ABC transporter permease [Candidatus Weimeria bifida]RRF97425.1 MAG: sugar ABC transporter permease [Lachnospiraceae bacterium]